MNRIRRLFRTVALLAAWTVACGAMAETACHDDAHRAAEQRALDESQIEAMRRDQGIAPVPPRLWGLLAELIAASPRLRDGPPVQLLGLQDQELNAFAADHGVVILTSALWAPEHGLTDDELAAVLAHELAHVEARDGLAEACEMQLHVGDARTAIGQVRARLATLNPGSALGQQAAELLHEQERVADARGVALLRRVGRDPHAMARVLAKLHAPSASGAAFTQAHTHPALADRLARVRALARD